MMSILLWLILAVSIVFIVATISVAIVAIVVSKDAEKE